MHLLTKPTVEYATFKKTHYCSAVPATIGYNGDCVLAEILSKIRLLCAKIVFSEKL